MDYAKIELLAKKYAKLALGVEEPTAVELPHRQHPLERPPERTMLSVTPEDSQRIREQEMPDFEYIPGYDNFSDAIDHLRTATGYIEAIKPSSYVTYSARALISDAALRILNGMKEVYKATPSDRLKASP